MIKKAKPRDLKSIMSLIKLNSDTFSESEMPVAEKSIKGSLKKQNRNNKFFIIRKSKKVVACCGYGKNDDSYGVYTLHWLAVHPDFKRQGLATYLYRYIDAQVKSFGGRLMILNAGSNETNRFFYKKMGFSVGGVIPRYYSQNKDLVWYYKKLIK